ncbi:hypothetical protein [Candidatus Odyssella acanthamoebae]|uniref:Uncharacterized protein n=1 Tax=Candidatus Odyssella acanthamoebae TaxID=91604 RepID=A0A077AX41_9PROT|nr:hypothetical protein [Candidatus Paracaedibacter acanthamoebae]AIK97161.1 hypothetical protein ID47_11125 [Candidatus Paracaedibacter acanthamoebae]
MKIRSLFCLALLSSASHTAEPFNLDNLHGMSRADQKRTLYEFVRQHQPQVSRNLAVNGLTTIAQEINAELLQQQRRLQPQQLLQQQQPPLAQGIIQRNAQPVQAPLIPVADNAINPQQLQLLNARLNQLRNQLADATQRLAQAQEAHNEELGRLQERINQLTESERLAQQALEERQQQLEEARQAPNEEPGRLQERINQLTVSERLAQQALEERQQQLEEAQEAHNEELGRLQEQINQLTESERLARQALEERQRQLEEARQAPNEERGRLQERINQLTESERLARQALEERQRQLEEARQAPNEELGRLQQKINQLTESQRLAQQALEERQRQLEEARQAPNEELERLQQRIQQLEEAARQDKEKIEDLEREHSSDQQSRAVADLNFPDMLAVPKPTATSSSSSSAPQSWAPPPPSNPQALTLNAKPQLTSSTVYKGKEKRKEKAEQKPFAQDTSQEKSEQQSLLDQIKTHKKVNLSSEELDLLRTIKKEIEEEKFVPIFTIFKPVTSTKTQYENEKPLTQSAMLATLRDIMKTRRQSMEIDSDDEDNIEFEWDEDKDTGTSQPKNKQVIEENLSTTSSVAPEWKTKIKRFRDIYRQAIHTVDPEKKWVWQNWVLWEYNNYRTTEQKQIIDEQVDKYIEENAAKLQEELGETVDFSKVRADYSKNKNLLKIKGMDKSVTDEPEKNNKSKNKNKN